VRAEIGDDPRIRLLGFIPEELLGDFYASLDVFALPSVNAFEAYGIVQAVAMLAGVPVLASDIPGVRQPLAETGFGTLIPPADAGAITTALRGLFDNPPDRAAGMAAARRSFSVDAVLDAYEVLLDKAASSARERSGR
jgi:glycosyltransferase involved in cell wall biosynthesis